MFSIKTVFLCLAFIALVIIAVPAFVAARIGRARKRNLAYETEVAVHWGGVSVPTIGKRVAPQELPYREYAMANLRKGCIDESDVRCNHAHDVVPRSILLFGERVILADDIPACADCMSALLVKSGTRCERCTHLVLPGDDVAITKSKGGVEFEHIRLGCCDDISRYCGVWGDFRLISLNDLFPTSFPSNQSRFSTLEKPIFGSRKITNGNLS